MKKTIHENKLKALIVKHIRENWKGLALSLHGHAMQEPGWPDIYIAHEQFVGWVEVKIGEGPLTPQQLRKAKGLLDIGTPIIVARWLQDLDLYALCTIGLRGAWDYVVLKAEGKVISPSTFCTAWSHSIIAKENGYVRNKK